MGHAWMIERWQVLSIEEAVRLCAWPVGHAISRDQPPASGTGRSGGCVDMYVVARACVWIRPAGRKKMLTAIDRPAERGDPSDPTWRTTAPSLIASSHPIQSNPADRSQPTNRPLAGATPHTPRLVFFFFELCPDSSMRLIECKSPAHLSENFRNP